MTSSNKLLIVDENEWLNGMNYLNPIHEGKTQDSKRHYGSQKDRVDDIIIQIAKTPKKKCTQFFPQTYRVDDTFKDDDHDDLPFCG